MGGFGAFGAFGAFAFGALFMCARPAPMLLLLDAIRDHPLLALRPCPGPPGSPDRTAERRSLLLPLSRWESWDAATAFKEASISRTASPSPIIDCEEGAKATWRVKDQTE